MDKSRKFAINFLKYLERIFPQDQVHSETWQDFGEYDVEVVKTLLENNLIEIKNYSAEGLPKEMPTKIISYKITSKGIEFLNGLKQKTTNGWLTALTIILTIIGVSQIVLMLIK